ncbi:MAG: hypothetical protein D6730_07190 [Bacteroidetes bacterium]|nr:MAG: hypothetical protein D6730_07190 [Bacteroidota bacterium]
MKKKELGSDYVCIVYSARVHCLEYEFVHSKGFPKIKHFFPNRQQAGKDKLIKAKKNSIISSLFLHF